MAQWNCTQICLNETATELDYGCDSEGWSGDVQQSNLTCQTLSSLVLTSNYSMVVELKIVVDIHTCTVHVLVI